MRESKAGDGDDDFIRCCLFFADAESLYPVIIFKNPSINHTIQQSFQVIINISLSLGLEEELNIDRTRARNH